MMLKSNPCGGVGLGLSMSNILAKGLGDRISTG
jgi:hypothetical protein